MFSKPFLPPLRFDTLERGTAVRHPSDFECQFGASGAEVCTFGAGFNPVVLRATFVPLVVVQAHKIPIAGLQHDGCEFSVGGDGAGQETGFVFDTTADPDRNMCGVWISDEVIDNFISLS